jgi:protein-S-isoprenylcysteine O-methyltransferase Ste14
MMTSMNRAAAGIASAVFFCAAPGVVAGLVPWLLTGWVVPPAPTMSLVVRGCLAVAAVLSGLVVLIAAFVRFVREGSGTPAPVAPTDRLVVGGMFRFVRNPMYLAVVTILLGQCVLFASTTLLIYTLVVWAAMVAFVRWYEEPVLATRYGQQYEEYRHHVRAWWPKLTPWNSQNEESRSSDKSKGH